MRSLVVMTLNVLGGAALWRLRRAALAHVVERERPDVLGLQEVHAPAEGASTQAHELAERIGGYHVDFAPGRVGRRGEREGVALLCRREIRERNVLALTLDPSDLLDRAGQRVVLAATLEVPDAIDVFVTHLSLSRAARVRTVTELVAFTAARRVRSASRAGILLGDLNASPREEAIRVLAASWSDAWRGPGAGCTWPLFVPHRRIDYVRVQPAEAWRVDECRCLPTLGSDHLGVVARLTLLEDERPTSHE
jgi:endonuclease/exonuclease/phosphatase family metal-dependent hydrolase